MQERERARLASLDLPIVRLPALPEGMDAGGLTELATELLAWRDDLTHFFQFNENSIPQARLAEAQQKQQMGQRSEFRQFEHDARKFMNTDWQAEEQEFLEQLQTLKAQAKQRQKALKALDDLAAR